MEVTELIHSLYFIALLFFFIAFFYSSVGLGGGSSYTALMAILGFSVNTIPMISLFLNLVVTSVGSLNYLRHGHVRFSLLMPFLLTSIPMAYIGGTMKLPQEIFYWLLFLSLIFVAARIYLWKDTKLKLNISNRGKLGVSVLAGSVLGFIAGSVGIGGGIYLVPLILVLGLGTQKEAAACGAIFILLNSLFGLMARLQFNSIDLAAYTPLVIAVLIGGLLGSHMGAVKYSARTMEKILGAIVIIAILVLARKLLFT